MGRTTPGRIDSVFAADTDVGRDLTAVEWHVTGLGPPSEWPQSLRTAIGILLSSRFSMWMLWGPQKTFFCNAAYRRDTLGHKYPWALGRPSDEVWSEIWDDVSARIESVLATGHATWDEGLMLFLERSGYLEETYHTFSYSPLRDDDGTVAGMLCVVSEDTDRIIASRRMATLRDLGSDTEMARTHEHVLDFAAAQLGRNRRDLPFTATYLFEDDGSARRAGAVAFTGLDHLVPSVVHADAITPWPVPDLARGESALVPLADGMPTGDWAEPPTRALVLPLRSHGGSPYGFLVAAVNRYRPLDADYRGFVSLVADHIASALAGARSYQAQERRTEELAELDRAKTVFFSNVSHEFRTPLTLILGPLQWLLDGPTVDPATRAQLTMAHRNALRVNRLVNTLLAFSRIEAGRMEGNQVPADVAVVTAELASMFRSAIERAGLVLVIDCPPVGLPVSLDRGMWETVIFNLLSNALKFTFAGRIAVAVRVVDDHVDVSVADTGVGVPEGEVPRLFERFHRVENTRSRSIEGSGIGLALVRELVDIHDGAITVDSAVDRGTTFTIRLPLASGELPPLPSGGVKSAGHTDAAEPFVREAFQWLPGDDGESVVAEASDVPTPLAAHRTAGARILIADDNADMRDYLTRILASAGYRVDAVADGRQALDSARSAVPDLIVSDVMMPVLDGLELVERLRSDSATASVPIMLLSARTGQEPSIEGLQAGADDYLAKPFGAVELLARVDANVALARLRNRHVRWRAALMESLNDGFFVSDDTGTIIEINAAFTALLGYGTDGLPYRPTHPWWPDADTDPEAYRQVSAAFAEGLGRSRGTYTLPVDHRDGHRLWMTVTFSKASDPESGRDIIVGTVRDVTAERLAARRADALSALGASLSQVSGVAGTLTAALSQFVGVWGADRVLAVLFDDTHTEGAPPTVTSTDGATWSDLTADHRRALTAMSHRPVLVPHTESTGLGTVLDHPNGRIALWVDTGGRATTEEDALTLAVLGARLAQGLVRAHQADLQRETAIALQRAILGPAQLPGGFAARYVPATRRLEVGGDWYDIVALRDGRYGIVVGDCVGHGLESATVMGQLRSACRALMLRDASPAVTLAALDEFAFTVPNTLCTTVFCGVLDPGTGRLTYASAGHPPGIVVDVGGQSRLLDQGRSLPLAVRSGAARTEAECTLPPRSALLLYTDGLVERRNDLLSTGVMRATRILADRGDLGVDDLAARLLTRLRPDGGYPDDVALLLYRQPAPLEITLPADPHRLAQIRQALGAWLDRCGLPPTLRQDVLVASGEACANCIEHAYRGRSEGVIDVYAEVRAERVRVVVSDSGRWKEPDPHPDPRRGRGIVLMRALMDRIEITRGPDGTSVDMTTPTVES